MSFLKGYDYFYPSLCKPLQSRIFQWVNEAQKMSYIDHYFITEAHKLINEHDKYDIIVFTTFDCIITAFPSLPGIYSTPCFIQPPFPKDIIPAYKILSHNAMRYNSIMVASISELSLEVRKDLYSHLFPNRVFDFECLVKAIGCSKTVFLQWSSFLVKKNVDFISSLKVLNLN